jgi:2-oxoisovalerate dehydrogenase E2 component (dihydrolipoyl transacylase)
MAEQALVMPKVGESVTEGTVLRWLKADGDMVAVDEPVVEVETEKVNVEIPSPWSGKLRVAAQEGDKVKVDEPLAFIETDASLAAAPPAPARRGLPAATAAPGRGALSGRQDAGDNSRATRYSPAVLNLAREHDIDLTKLRGSGLFGRITRKDVLAYIEGRAAAAQGAAAPGPSAPAPATAARPAAPTPAAAEGDQLVPLSATRRTIAERMLRSVQQVPHAWLMMEADVTGLVKLRTAVKDEFARREGVELTFLPFFIKAAVEGLREHPVLNSTWGEQGVVLKRRINIGVAVAAEEGLIVPVVHDADELSIAGLARRLADVAERARARRLRIEDVEGGTFTVDNTGAFGSVVSVPIINFPQAAIMTVEAIVKRPVVREDAIAIRDMVNLCLSFDHRILDGAQAGRFLASVRQRLEDYGPQTALF